MSGVESLAVEPVPEPDGVGVAATGVVLALAPGEVLAAALGATLGSADGDGAAAAVVNVV
jgi:hypothetical protein